MVLFHCQAEISNTQWIVFECYVFLSQSADLELQSSKLWFSLIATTHSFFSFPRCDYHYSIADNPWKVFSRTLHHLHLVYTAFFSPSPEPWIICIGFTQLSFLLLQSHESTNPDLLGPLHHLLWLWAVMTYLWIVCY